MTSKHYKWQTRWHVANGIATHDTGLVVSIAGGQPRANNARQVIESLTPKHGHNAPDMVARLLRAAGPLMASALPRS